jgi:hypothetical protein
LVTLRLHLHTELPRYVSRLELKDASLDERLDHEELSPWDHPLDLLLELLLLLRLLLQTVRHNLVTLLGPQRQDLSDYGLLRLLP